MRNKGHKVYKVILCLLAVFGVTGITNYIMAQQPKVKEEIKPQVPGADRFQKNKVFLEYADELIADEKATPNFQVLKGNVKFRKEGMFMYCDSAYFYEKNNSFDAFGNVKMEQGDTLFVYADFLYYNGDDEYAKLRNNVRLENKEVTLFTDSLDYDMIENLGYYFEGGKIVDEKNELSSVYGQYEPDTKEAQFLYDVELSNNKYVMQTDTLHYNTNTKIAKIVGFTTIVSDSNIIYTSKGWYNTAKEIATLYNRSILVGKNNERLTGDTIFYDRNIGYGEAFGRMELTDSVHRTIIDGDYGYHNEKKNYSYATRRARVREFSQKDTLYLHADTIKTYVDVDTMRIMVAYPKVRFFRSDIQGLCDSMSMEERDSVLKMFKHPIIWTGARQIFGNEIYVHLNDSTVDFAELPNTAFVAEHIGEIYYNQLAGKKMTAYFNNGELRQLDVDGNARVLMLPMENDSTYNKYVTAEGSYLKMLLKPKQEIDRISMWPQPVAKAVPLYKAKQRDLYLDGFQWFGSIRPQNADDIFVIPKEMELLLNKSTGTDRKIWKREMK
ncbi:MAG: hypothetical protein E7080_02300 [Bacteroidales bacterium]|nr:hypothetical protein [Bacteroidales bacterium]